MKDLFSHKHNVRFYHCPKNAMTSIIKAIEAKWTPVDEMPEEYRTIAVVREPFDRAVSAYLEVTKYYQIYKSNHSQYCREIEPQRLNVINKDINTYIEELITNGPWDNHQLQQCYYLNSAYGRKIENAKIFKISELNEMEKYIGGINIGRLNVKSSSDKQRVKSLMEPHRDEILKLYGSDLAIWENA